MYCVYTRILYVVYCSAVYGKIYFTYSRPDKNFAIKIIRMCVTNLPIWWHTPCSSDIHAQSRQSSCLSCCCPGSSNCLIEKSGECPACWPACIGKSVCNKERQTERERERKQDCRHSGWSSADPTPLALRYAEKLSISCWTTCHYRGRKKAKPTNGVALILSVEYVYYTYSRFFCSQLMNVSSLQFLLSRVYCELSMHLMTQLILIWIEQLLRCLIV